jgi:lactate dehydrogenase-like 2-hydroxyacid dehydrogenase
MAARLTDLPLVIIMTRKERPPVFQKIIDSYSDKLTVVAMDKITEDKYAKVEGMLIYSPFVNVTSQLIGSFPNLRIISTPSAGVNHIDVKEANERGIKIGFTPRVIGDSTADLAFGLLVASARNIVEGDAISKSPNTLKVST